MTSPYIKQLEHIIREMQTTLPKPDYLPWLHFLHEVHPESELLRAGEGILPQAREPTVGQETSQVKHCHDIRELMMLAERNGYPTWYIHPYREGDPHEEHEPILFPTNKIQSISSHVLAELFNKYLSTLHEQGIVTDGILIKGEGPITDIDGETHAHLIFRSNNSD
jgi:hypothetical protein